MGSFRVKTYVFARARFGLRIRVGQGFAAFFEAFVEPEVLLGCGADRLLDQLVNAGGVGQGILGREVFQGRLDGDLIAVFGSPPGKKRNDLGAPKLGNAARRRVGPGRLAKKRHQGTLLDLPALVRRVPDLMALAQGFEEAAGVLQRDDPLHLDGAALSHDAGKDGVIRWAVERAELAVLVEDPGVEFERGEVGGEE